MWRCHISQWHDGLTTPCFSVGCWSPMDCAWVSSGSLSMSENCAPYSAGHSALPQTCNELGTQWNLRGSKMVQNPIILHDNARSHTVAAVTDLLRRWQWEILEHPPYSPNMSPWDYDLFAKVKESLWDPTQHKIWTYPCSRAVNTEHQQRWMLWWCTTPSKYLTNMISEVDDCIEGT